MPMQLPTLTPAQAGIVKLAAARRLAELNVAPQTASYVFARFLGKCAAAKPPTATAVKLAGQLEQLIVGRRAAPAQA